MTEFNALQRLVMWVFRIRYPHAGHFDRNFGHLFPRYTGATTGRTRSTGFARELAAGYGYDPEGGKGFQSRDPYADAAARVFAVDPGKDADSTAIVEFVPFANMPGFLRDGHRARGLMRRAGFWKGVDPDTGITVDLLLNREACQIVSAARNIGLAARVIERTEGWGVLFPTAVQ